jgi:Na+/H+ antiporter NhaD/arsenite permease-like protein
MNLLTITALGIFILVYIIISLELVNKTVIALLGAMVFIVLHVIGQEEAFRSIDWNVIFLLISMMIIVGITKSTGLFQYVAIKTAKAAKGHPMKILLGLSAVTALFSAVLDNITTILIIAPVTLLIAVELGVSPVPFIISEAMASNIGGTATLIGDPPNIMIGSAAHLDFLSFLYNLAPAIIVVFIVFSGIIYLLFRKEMEVSNERRARIMEFDESKSIENPKLLRKCLAVLGFVILGFIFHGMLNIEAATIGLLGASVLLLLTGNHEVDEYFRDIEWGTIFFFIGLFILVGGIVELGAIRWLSEHLLSLTQGDIKLTSVFILWASGIISGIVDNIPYVATMIPLIHTISTTVGEVAAEPLWWSLALGACLGGNGTLVGASANVVAAGIATKSGYKITFLQFTRYGLLVTFLSLGISTLYVLLRYF